ncbi:MAG: VWA domain-containing protein, partial [Myxococcales bacterium]|nr:VWA domain-containing protein [Myxococcales bacterium]
MKRRDRAPRALARGRVIVATTIGLGLARCVELEDPEECVSQRAAVEQLRLNCDCDDPTGDDDDGAASDSGTSASPGHGYGDGDVDADGSTGQDDVGCGCDVAGPPERCAEVAAEYARLRASCKCDEPDPPEPAPACDLDTPVTLYLSPDDSNSMSSPVQAREAILGGGGAPTIRPWEFLNYYRFDYPAAAPGAVTISAELRALDVEGEYYLQIGVGSANVRDSERAPVNLTLVLDESGSMSGHAIEMLKESCVAIASQLRAGDIVSMVTWDTDNAVLLAAHEVSGPYDAALIERVEQIESGGGTDLNGGLTAGYELARAAFHRDRINRVVLVSDGGANVGVTDATLIGEASRDEDAEGIYMVGVGVGGAGYNDYLMDVVTDLGKGASVFIPDEAEAWKIFGERFVNTLDVAVRDVQVQLDLPPG